MPPVSPLKGSRRAFRVYRKEMEEEEMLREESAGRLTPRLLCICDMNCSYPIDEVFACYEVGQRLGILDVCAMEDEEFSNPMAASAVKEMALSTDFGRPAVSLRVTPAPVRLMKGTSSSLQSEVKTKVKGSIFDVVSPTHKPGGSKSTEEDARDAAVSSLLAWVDEARRELLMGGYALMPVALRQQLLREAVAKMGSVGAIAQCARVLRKADAWLRARFSARHGFRMQSGIVIWFLFDHAVQEKEGSGYHVSEYCRAGLVFAKLHLQMEIEVQEEVVSAFSKRVSHTPVPAASASVRLVVELLIFANDVSRNGRERYFSAAFAVMALAALRGIDAQRSNLEEVHDLFFVGRAWDSKKKRAMVWACPNKFLGYDILPILQMFWKGDYLFPQVTGKRGCSLAESVGFGDSMASAYVILRHFRELAAAVGMPAEAAAVIRRHSWRHFAANITRVAEFADSKKSQVGRWNCLEVMPVRYAQEVENVAMMGIVLEIEQVLDAALARVPLCKWPWLAGWENLSPHVALRPSQAVPMECMPEPEDRSDDEDSDVEEGVDAAVADDVNGRDDSAAVLEAWDALQRAKVPARTTVGGWVLEFVLRKVSERSVGDCYAKCAGRPRVRSRVALLTALGLQTTPLPAISEAAESVLPGLGGGEASGSNEDGRVMGNGPEEVENTGNGMVVDPGASAPGKRPADMPVAIWKLVKGGFPDGDTVIVPPKALKRGH